MSSPLFLPFPQTQTQDAHTPYTHNMAEASSTATASPGGISQLVGHKNFVRHNPLSDRFEVREH